MTSAYNQNNKFRKWKLLMIKAHSFLLKLYEAAKEYLPFSLITCNKLIEVSWLLFSFLEIFLIKCVKNKFLAKYKYDT